jgi:hypothetical protein
MENFNEEEAKVEERSQLKTEFKSLEKAEAQAELEAQMTQNQAKKEIANYWFFIEKRGFCMRDPSFWPRDHVLRQNCREEDDEVKWRFVETNGRFKIQNKKSGRFLGMSQESKENGALFYAGPSLNHNEQLFEVINIEGNKYHLKNVSSKKCIDTNSYHDYSKNKYQQWDCNKGNSTLLTLRKIAKIEITQNQAKKKITQNQAKKKITQNQAKKKITQRRQRPPRGFVHIRGSAGLCVQTATKKRVTQGPCNGNDSLWRFVQLGKHYIIENRNGQVLDVYAFKENNGAHIYAWDRNNKNNQRWQYIPLGNGRFLLKSRSSNKCFDNTGVHRRGVGYHQWQCDKRNGNQIYTTVLSASSRRRGNRVTRRRTTGGRGNRVRRNNRNTRNRGNIKKNNNKRINVRNNKRVTKRNKRTNNQMKYKKNKNLKFIDGKYSFNLKSGKEFCSTKCQSNEKLNSQVCFKNGVKSCKPCSFNGSTKDELGKDSQELCRIACRSIKKDRCDFYAYVDENKKVINKRLLNRFGRIFSNAFVEN